MQSLITPAFRFGKLPPRRDPRTLRFEDYLLAALPPPAPAHDVLAMVYAHLGIADPTRLFPLDGNDILGDCTIAALAHALTTWQGLVHRKSVMTRAAVVDLYLKLTGGEDTGLAELDVLNYWRKHAVSGDEILAYVAVDRGNRTHVKQAIALFGGVYLGFAVQRDCLADFKARRPWTPGPLTGDGHAVVAVAYDSKGVTVLTWGNTQRATWAWWDACVEEAYAILPPEAAQSGFAPGFSVAQLRTDLAALAS